MQFKPVRGMSDNTSKQSVRQLPPGKLDDLKKLFEDDASEAQPSKFERQAPPPRPPPPPARVKSPERPKLPVGKKPQHLIGQKISSAGQDSSRAPHPTSRDADLAASAASVVTARKYSPNAASTDAGQNPSPGLHEYPALSPKPARKVIAHANSPSSSNTSRPAAKPPPPIKPPMQKSSNVVIDNPVYGGFQQREQVGVADMYSKVNKEAKHVNPSSKVSTDQEPGNIQRREAVRRTSGERRKTVASFEIEADSQDIGSGVSVASRTKLFDGPTGGKPALPKKSEAVRSKSMRAPRENVQQKLGVTNDRVNGREDIYEPPWDSTKSSVVEKLRQSHLRPQSAADPPPNLNTVNKGSPSAAGKPTVHGMKPPPLPSQPPPKVSAGGKRCATSDSITKPLPNSSPMKAPPPLKNNIDIPAKTPPAAPPPKPPRTHAHDNYILTKLSQGTEMKDQAASKAAKQSGEPNTEGGIGSSAGETEHFSIKDRVAQMMRQKGSETQSSPPETRSSHLLPKDQEVAMRQTPPSRPPPPKSRPNSGESNASSTPRVPPRPPNQCPEHKPRPGGPIIIPVFPKRQQKAYQRQSSATYDRRSRRPTDDLPQEPSEGNDDYNSRHLQRFPLRKSYSSECLHSSRGSSLNLSTAGTWGDSSGMGESMSRSAYDYEAVIDPDGYAVPNEFVRLPSNKNEPPLERPAPQANAGHFLTKLRGFEASPSNCLSPAGAGKDDHKGGKGPGAKHDLTKVNKKKMIMVREKINQAYAALDVALRGQTEGEEDGSDNTPGSLPEPEEAVVEPTELKRRIEYCTSVRLKSSKSIKHSKEYTSAIYPQLFEYCLVVGLRPLVDVSGYEPYLIHKFPENRRYKMGPDGSILLPTREISSNLSVPNFCFPDASIYKPGSTTSVSESYSFVMTYADGSRVYGYCRRIQPPDSSLPEVICIISPIDAFNMYNTLLSEIESRRRVSSDLALEVIAASFGRPLPKPGKVCHIRTLDSHGEMETIFLNRPTDNRLDDVNYESPLFYLGTDRLVKVFSSMLMERRIILCSSNLSILTQTVHALSALLYPFHWQHVYVPLLPSEMLDVVCAPMPYILGVLTAFLPQVLQMDTEQVFIVDLDKKSIVKSQGDESTILPRKVQRALKTAINMCKIDSDAHNAQWLIVAEAFLRMFIETTGHFPNHVRTQQDGNRIFQKEGFILEMVSKELRQFLEWFTETQMFEVFIVDLVDNPDCWTNDLFMQRLKEHRESKEENNHRKGLGAKVKNFGKALKIKLQAT